MFRQRPKEIKDCLLENDRFHVSGESFITNGPDDFAAHEVKRYVKVFDELQIH